MIRQLLHNPVILLLLGGLAAVLAVTALLLWLAYGPRAQLRRRLRRVIGSEGQTGTGEVGSAALRGKSLQQKLKALEKSRNKPRSLRQSLIQAGVDLTPPRFVMMVAAGALSFGALAGKMMDSALLGGLIALIVGLGIPRLLLGMMTQKRVARFTGQFVDALDVIVRGVRSGLPVGECLAVIGRELPDPLGQEFRTLQDEQKLGLSIDEALKRMHDRLPSPELRYFNIVLSIQQSTGGNLAETLVKLADVLRSRKRMRDKARALSSEATSSAAIIGALPVVVTLLLSVVAPDYIGILFTTSTGHYVIAVGMGFMGVGVLVMRNMINFDL